MAIYSFEQAFTILQIPSTSSIDEIRKAYRELAKLHHPDRGGRVEDFIRIRAAYEILKQHYKDTDSDEFDIPIPEELEKLIREIVAGFYSLQDNAQSRVRYEFRKLKSKCLSEIRESSISGLSDFDRRLQKRIKNTIHSCFDKTSEDLENLLKGYDIWFTEKFKETFDTLYNFQRTRFYRAKSFKEYLMFSIIIALIFSHITAWIIFFPVVLVLMYIGYRYHLHSFKRNEFLLKVSSFEISTSQSDVVVESMISKIRELKTLSIGSAYLGFRTGHPIIGAIVAIGSMVVNESRSAQKKQELINATDSIIDGAENELVDHLNQHLHKLSKTINNDVEENYRSRNRNIVKLITQQ